MAETLDQKSKNSCCNDHLRDRLLKLLGMTDSAHDPEALTAIRLANRTLAAHKLTWHDVLPAAESLPEAHEADPDPFEPWGGWRAAAKLCAKHGRGCLTPWEANFCLSLTAFIRISPKQAGILGDCLCKMGLARAAA